MTTNIDIQRDNFKFLDYYILSQENLVNREQKLIDKLLKQIDFINSHLLSEFQLKLKISRRWRSWNRK